MLHVAKFAISADKNLHTETIARLVRGASSNLSLHTTDKAFHTPPLEDARYLVLGTNRRATILGVSFMVEAPTEKDLKQMLALLQLPSEIEIQFISV